MKQTVNHNTYGEIVYEENFWTGKKNIILNGTELKKVKKNVYKCENEENPITVLLKGNFLAGTKMKIGEEIITVTNPPLWYEIVLAALIAVMGIVFIGGAIGGAIGGFFAVLALLLMKSVNKAGIKVLIGVSFTVATFIIGLIIGIIYVVSTM